MAGRRPAWKLFGRPTVFREGAENCPRGGRAPHSYFGDRVKSGRKPRTDKAVRAHLAVAKLLCAFCAFCAFLWLSEPRFRSRQIFFHSLC